MSLVITPKYARMKKQPLKVHYNQRRLNIGTPVLIEHFHNFSQKLNFSEAFKYINIVHPRYRLKISYLQSFILFQPNRLLLHERKVLQFRKFSFFYETKKGFPSKCLIFADSILTLNLADWS